MTARPAIKEKEFENIVPFRPLTMIDEMERMFENILPHGWMRPLRWERALLSEMFPLMDVIDRDEYVLVRVAVPGARKEDLEVSTTDHTVTIRGRTGYETKEEKGEYYRHEIGSGSFLRTVTLPAAVDEAKAKAAFKDGLLELTLPKLESARRHTVEIKEE